MSNSAAFEELSALAESLFAKTSLSPEQKERWGYSICGVPITQGAPLICGMNWGGGRNPEEAFSKQRDEGSEKDFQDVRSYRFIQLLVPYLEQYCGFSREVRFNYTNLCPFRTPDINFLTHKDWELGSALIRRFIELTRPSWIIFTTSDEAKVLLVAQREQIERHQVRSEKRGFVYTAYSGTIDGIPFAAVPHPQAKIDGPTRRKLWEAAVRTHKF